jgi:hypothetical protein
MAPTKQFQELGEFKVGMKVLMSEHSGAKSIRPIDKITSGLGGTIFVDGQRFAVNGHQRGDGWYKSTITPATLDDAIEIQGINARRRIAKVEWNKLSPSQALTIEELLNENGIKTK